MKGKTIILLEENYMTTFPDFGVDEAFLYNMQKVPTIKSDKVKNIKMKDFVSNDTPVEMKIYPTNSERRFSILIFNREFISRIFQKHPQIIINKPREK